MSISVNGETPSQELNQPQPTGGIENIGSAVIKKVDGPVSEVNGVSEAKPSNDQFKRVQEVKDVQNALVTGTSGGSVGPVTSVILNTQVESSMPSSPLISTEVNNAELWKNMFKSARNEDIASHFSKN